MADLVLSETRDRVTVLTLNRPEKLNALNYALIDRLLAILDTIETDDAVRAVILTGAGERAFSAGGDINEFSLSVAAGTDVALRDFVMRGQRLTARLEAFRKPIIAAVNGIAFGGGCEITEAERLGTRRPEERVVPACTLLFADHTRGHRRRWCSMAQCGNRAKQVAHRHRIKAHHD